MILWIRRRLSAPYGRAGACHLRAGRADSEVCVAAEPLGIL